MGFGTALEGNRLSDRVSRCLGLGGDSEHRVHQLNSDHPYCASYPELSDRFVKIGDLAYYALDTTTVELPHFVDRSLPMPAQRHPVNQHPIQTLFTWNQSKKIAIPETTRPCVCGVTKIRDLLDSLCNQS
jgi:hypothetical protein